MLVLKNITKDYTAGDSTVKALKGVSLSFRENEFVSILGQSGCGKTTLLNIIGGLDQYTTGDLVINGKSTKDFTDGDWDSYRNHSIGFVFQTYNLIPHQSVLANVELALTLSGVSKSERRQRAIHALEQVGLGDQLYKKPNQMSGGQMQRVAIARALVNDPDILLADEPTGALDSETSVQIMDILREISKNKLIIMVTHNPTLAEQYSTRIIRLLDGVVTDDSMPFSAEQAPSPHAYRQSRKKTSMSFFTALSLSLNNLMTKKARTLLTAFAGSIGIIGIALILSLSNGIQNYIDRVQADTLSSYPITIEKESVDLSSTITSMMGTNSDRSEQHELDAVYSNTVMYDLMNSMTNAEVNTNDMASFKEFLESEDSGFSQHVSAVQYNYGLNLNVYTEDDNGDIVKSDVTELLNNTMSSMYGGDYSSYFSSFSGTYSRFDAWQEMLSGENGEPISDILKEQYDVIYGSWPSNYDEVVLIVDKNNEVSDLVLYSLGLKSSDSLAQAMEQMMKMEEVSSELESWSYEDICGRRFKVILPCEQYQYDSATGGYTDISTTDTGLRYLYSNSDIGIELKIVGILRENEDAVSTMLSGSIGYTSALTNYVIDKTAASDIVRSQLESSDVDVISNLPFSSGDTEITENEKQALVDTYISTLTNPEKAALYTAVLSVPSGEYLDSSTAQAMSQMTREYVETMLLDNYAAETSMDAESLQNYVSQMDDETLMSYVRDMVEQTILEQYAQGVQAQLGNMTTDQLAYALDSAQFSAEQYNYIYDELLPETTSSSTYDENLSLLGYVDKSIPSSISIYASTFADKDSIADIISSYNETVDEERQIAYTDYVALLMSSITTIINAISYVLIAFVAISLVVSSIMIGIITYISVLERTKEIGILRAIGASKRDISRVFNAETLIVGFASGVIGIGLTLLLTIPINLIVHSLTGIQSLNAALPVAGGVILVLISMLLTFIAGLIPSGIAAKKDPVVALRTE